MIAIKRGPEVMASPPSPEKKTTSNANHTSRKTFVHVVHWCERALKEVGLVPTRSGFLVDNRDGFFDEYPDDYLRVYDSRTHLAISRSLFEKLMLALEAA